MRTISSILIIVLVITSSDCVIIKNSGTIIKVLEGFEEYRRTGTPPSSLIAAVKQYTQNFSSGQFGSDPACATCSIIADNMIKQRRSGMNDTEIQRELIFFCNLYEVYDEKVCEGMVNISLSTFLYILDNTPDLEGSDVCGITLQYRNCVQSERFNWSIEIPPERNFIKLLSTSISEKPIRILHISDIHYDPRYTKGKTNNCKEPICCQDDQADGKTEEESCGYWSDYLKADLPWRTVVDALEQTTNHEYDYVYFTGDIVSHRIWNTSVQENGRIISKILDALSQYYKVPVFLSIGNHETHPSNLYSEITSPENLSSKWLFDLIFQKLSKWLPVDDIKDTILKGGYYTVSPKKGFRVIVLNSNVCNINNWWLLYDPVDPYGQLKWLTEVLKESEQNNERVHILYHMPSGGGVCYSVWAREFRRIVARFAHTIAAQFNGHTHRDEFYVFYNISNPEQPINMAWNGASVTTFDLANPSFKIISIDEKTFNVLDFEEWTYNLTLANLTPEKNPSWYKLYAFKEAFDVENLEADQIHNLVMKMTQRHALLDLYHRYKFREGDTELAKGCDDDCKKDLLCSMVKTQYGDDYMCNKVKKLFDSIPDAKLTS
ncbi:sphingomyelin phosphodiesterase 1-like isoform X1 [Diorhabda sublineata]|uniref:sphingomyelin phosphodiesterase 1-like isoform X1 n=1 Tax=Diorhabda sublineata TaxID=1163346 RepID=UPI0024E18FA6|nr:sphingomyelin phosphodiesterase 1-like isoform X1 [Diorhabda sublineata]